jgi:hypothetical protein
MLEMMILQIIYLICKTIEYQYVGGFSHGYIPTFSTYLLGVLNAQIHMTGLCKRTTHSETAI